MIYVFPCVVTDVFERVLQKYVSGSGEAAVFSTSSMGWYLQIDGMVSIFVGEDRPDWQIGDKIEMSLRKD